MRFINNQTPFIVKTLYGRLPIAGIIILLAALFFSCEAPKVPKHYIINPAKIKTKNNLNPEQKEFIAGFLPKIRYENDLIRIDRQNVIEYFEELQGDDDLNRKQQENLNRILAGYDMKPFNWEEIPEKDKVINRMDSLKSRVDIIPIKLVMAQAIIESGWGTSRFAKEGNNYFGIHCFTEGCGMKAGGITHGNFEVKVFPSADIAIKTYMHILNTGYAYEELRQIRAKLRKNGEALSPIALAAGLGMYSQIGDKYAKIIESVIENYLPANITGIMDEKSD